MRIAAKNGFFYGDDPLKFVPKVQVLSMMNYRIRHVHFTTFGTAKKRLPVLEEN